MIIFAATKGYEFITFSNKNKYSMPPLVNLFCQNSHNVGQNTEIQNTKMCLKSVLKHEEIFVKTYVYIEDLFNPIKYCKNFKINLIHISKSTLYDLFCLLSSKFLPPLIPIQISICLWVRIHMKADTDIGFGSASTSLVRICHLSKRAKLIL